MKGSQCLDCDDGLMVCIYIKTYQIVYFIICQLHLKKAVWKKSRNKDAKQYHILFMYAADKCSVVSNSLQPHGLQPSRLLCPWNISRQEYWSGLPFPTPRDLPTQGSNLHFLYLLLGRHILNHCTKDSLGSTPSSTTYHLCESDLGLPPVLPSPHLSVGKIIVSTTKGLFENQDC